MTLVYVSPVPWDSFTQRPHQFVRWYHNTTSRNVVWIEPYPVRLPKWSDFRRISGSADKRTGAAVPDWLKVVHVPALPIEPIPGINTLNHLVWRGFLQEFIKAAQTSPWSLAIGKPCLLALLLMKKISFISTLYDAMDNFPHFSTGISRWSVSKIEQLIATRVDQVITSSHNQLARLKHSKTLSVVLNACDMAQMQNVHIPAKRHSTVIGYVGTMGEWFDWELVIRLAIENPQHVFKLIGPVFKPSPHRLPSNIELKGACEHSTAINEMAQFSIGLIPFKLNELTQSVDPIKYYEYRALGIPILSTRFGEMLEHAHHGGVTFVSGLEDCSKVIDLALKQESSHKEIQLFRKENTWENRFNQLQFDLR